MEIKDNLNSGKNLSYSEIAALAKESEKKKERIRVEEEEEEEEGEEEEEEEEEEENVIDEQHFFQNETDYSFTNQQKQQVEQLVQNEVS